MEGSRTSSHLIKPRTRAIHNTSSHRITPHHTSSHPHQAPHCALSHFVKLHLMPYTAAAAQPFAAFLAQQADIFNHLNLLQVHAQKKYTGACKQGGQERLYTCKQGANRGCSGGIRQS
eukprot:1158190-Pelagomonas_calceolata.AAC.6